MTRVLRHLSLMVVLAIAVTSCDSKPQPRFVSDAREFGAPKAAFKANTDGRYFIEFRSRYALSYGHSYVIFGRLDKAGAMVNPEVAGLAPAGTSTTPYILGHLVPVPAETGASDGDLEEAYRSASWRVLLREAEYRKTVAYIRQLQAKSRVWQASIYNCNAFVADIARSMGYRTPVIWMRPQQFITKLRQINGG
ncbi:hypothetical protein [Pararhizobium sp. PWRC1-1]|uniref:hypothetical protein n=1 Tax=Pararhizobium sp. PWRC1-1 TaxID=2804566 RepID=UPI003CEA6511